MIINRDHELTMVHVYGNLKEKGEKMKKIVILLAILLITSCGNETLTDFVENNSIKGVVTDSNKVVLDDMKVILTTHDHKLSKKMDYDGPRRSTDNTSDSVRAHNSNCTLIAIDSVDCNAGNFIFDANLLESYALIIKHNNRTVDTLLTVYLNVDLEILVDTAQSIDTALVDSSVIIDSAIVVGEKEVWKSAIDSSDVVVYWLMEFTAKDFYHNKVIINDDGSEEVKNIGIGTYLVEEDSIHLTMSELYQLNGDGEYVEEVFEDDTETVSYLKKDDILILHSDTLYKDSSEVLREP